MVGRGELGSKMDPPNSPSSPGLTSVDAASAIVARYKIGFCFEFFRCSVRDSLVSIGFDRQQDRYLRVAYEPRRLSALMRIRDVVARS